VPSPTVVFAFPGGGFERTYFDLRVPDRGTSYSMALALAVEGCIVVACDLLGCGESDQPPRPFGTADFVAANHQVVVEVLDRLQQGQLHPGLPAVRPGLVVGLGHSMGAGLVTAQQAATRDFNGLVLLGRSVGATQVPAPPSEPGGPAVWRALAEQYTEIAASAQVVPGGLRQDRLTSWQRFLYHWEDVDDDVVDFGESILTTFPVDVARELGGPDGLNARAAGVVDVPILLAFGERDVSPAPALEATKYPSAPTVDVKVVPRCGHAHHFASTRLSLWRSIADWIAVQTKGRSQVKTG
jgi:pimeloyl-ACP methyl ester carboxylesterase